MVDVEEVHKELRRAVDTGKVEFGSKKVLESASHGKTQAIVCAGNLPENVLSKIKRSASLSNIPLFVSDKNGLELGQVCGKPFNVGSASILDSGRSKILEALKA
ncbi:MAG TPA: 50S ribosomal protein L30e [archaeon]|nr:50S ribosomal protein L30e [archaeon]